MNERVATWCFVVAGLVGCGTATGLEHEQQPVPPQPPFERAPAQRGIGHTPISPDTLSGCFGRSVVVASGPSIFLLGSDGSRRELFRFDVDAFADRGRIGDVQLRGDFVGAWAWSRPLQYEYVVLRLDGTRVFHRVQEQQHTSPQVWLGLDGSLAVAETVGWLGRPDGSVMSLDGLWPVGPVLESKRLPVSLTGIYPAGLKLNGFIEVDSGRTQTLPEPPANPQRYTVVGDRLLYASETAFIEVGGDTVERYPIAKSLPVDPTGWGGWFVVNPRTTSHDAMPRFLLVADGYAPSSHRVRLDRWRGVVESMPLRLDGFTFSARSVALDGAGAVLLAADLGETMQLARSTDLGVTWSAVGGAIAKELSEYDAGWAFIVDRGDTTLVATMASTWTSPHRCYTHAMRLSGTDREVSLDVATDAQVPGMTGTCGEGDSLRPIDLSDDGACAATWKWGGVRSSTSPQLDNYGASTIVFVDRLGRQTRGAELPVAGQLRFVR